MILSMGSLLVGLVLPPLLHRIARSSAARASTGILLLHGVVAAAWCMAGIGLSASPENSSVERMVLIALAVVAGTLYTLLFSYLGTDRHSHSHVLTPPADEMALEPLGPRDASAGASDPDALEPEGAQLLERISALETLSVDRVMIPREGVRHLEANVTVGVALEAMRASGRGRVLVVEGGLDRVLGVAHAKDLVPLALEGGSATPVRPHLRRWLRIPPDRTIAGLLEDFRQHRVHLGVVGDVRGRTLGLVTLQDVLNHIATPESPHRSAS